MKSRQVLLALLCCFFFSFLNAQGLNALAKDFLNTLSPELRERTLFSLDDEERYNFHYTPVRRKGPSFNDFNEAQKKAALKLLKASLSAEGYRKSIEIMALEGVLRVIEQNNYRDDLDYHFCIFHEVDSDAFWGWRFEGHHLSLNFVISEGKLLAGTPAFFGANPAKVAHGPQQGKEVLGSETHLAFALVNSFSKIQLSKARFSEQAPREILTRTKRKVAALEPKGIGYVALTDAQKKTFLQLLRVYVDNYETLYAQSLWSKIEKGGLDRLYFAWAGGLRPGVGHYYRIQGPSLLIEYDNTQNGANHVHSVVRDLTNDFGEDLLRNHLEKHHKD